MDGYVKLPEHLLKGNHEIWLPCSDDVIPLSVHMTSCRLFQFGDGEWLCGVQIENEAVQSLIDATDADNAADAISELNQLGIGTYWIGVVGDEERMKIDFPELAEECMITDDNGIESTIPVFRGWGGVKQ